MGLGDGLLGGDIFLIGFLMAPGDGLLGGDIFLIGFFSRSFQGVFTRFLKVLETVFKRRLSAILPGFSHGSWGWSSEETFFFLFGVFLSFSYILFRGILPGLYRRSFSGPFTAGFLMGLGDGLLRRPFLGTFTLASHGLGDGLHEENLFLGPFYLGFSGLGDGLHEEILFWRHLPMFSHGSSCGDFFGFGWIGATDWA